MENKDITKLQYDLLLSLIDKLRANKIKKGSILNESIIAEYFHVSRTPLRKVLEYLSRENICEKIPNKGFILLIDSEDIESFEAYNTQKSNQELLYLKLLMDIFLNKIGPSFSENEIQKRYSVTKNEARSTLKLMENDEICSRSPGYKWQLNGVFNTLERHSESYRCRIVFEPAGLLEPTWNLKREKLEACRDKHIKAISHPESIDAIQLYNLSAEFHELLAECSGNRFFLNNMQKHNRLRKAADLISMYFKSSVRRSCQRRLDILELVLTHDNKAASDKLIELLENDIKVMEHSYREGLLDINDQECEEIINGAKIHSRTKFS